MDYSINFNEEKNQLLKESRKICFDDIVNAIEKKELVGNIPHFNQKEYPNQFLFLVIIDHYVYVVPYVINKSKNEIYLKTLYPSRRFNKLYGDKK
ncbi:MAG: hypothetical protein A2770_02645 [Candidatus Levybacteria bacterium RIFCSPHIGHO2_01_FULL_38_12]|nr:MAG: hypothetical protein A2770_02645 [Candidatus Levybacteria bacterium RIFCSPHIGHO2_01_FULL_38_12]